MWLDEFVLVKSSNGERVVKADIMADTVPSTFPTDGTDIEGLDANDTLYKGSSIYVIGTASLYILNSAGSWIQQ